MTEELDGPKPPDVPSPPSGGEIDAGGVVVVIICLVAGAVLLLPGGLCSVSGLVMGVSGHDPTTAILFLAIGLPCALLGGFLIRVGWRRMRRG